MIHKADLKRMNKGMSTSFNSYKTEFDGVLFFDPQRMRSLSDLRYEPPQPDGENADEPSDEQTAKRKSIPVVVSAA